jgi:hypothetical protein
MDQGLDAGLLPQRPGFDSKPIYVRLVVDNVGLGLFFLFQYYTTNAP